MARHFVIHPPDAMTLRARWYLTIGASRHLLIGLFAISKAHQFGSIYIPVISYAPLWTWGSIFVLTALICYTACLLRSASWARLGLIFSATSTLAVGVGIGLGVALAWRDGQQVTPILPILLLSLAAKDYAVCTQPMRSPFEQLLKQTTQSVDADTSARVQEFVDSLPPQKGKAVWGTVAPPHHPER